MDAITYIVPALAGNPLPAIDDAVPIGKVAARMLGAFRRGIDTVDLARLADAPEPLILRLLGYAREMERRS